jgi:hypothetical protein
MTEPWFNPMQYAWIPGTVLGMLGGVYGTAVGVLAPRGKARGAVMAMHWTFVAISVVLLAAGVVALVQGQPYGVWYGLGLAGLIGTIVFGVNTVTVVRAYEMAERRKMSAQDALL